MGFFLSRDPDFNRSELLNVVLDSPQDFVEERVIWLPRAGPVTLGIVYTRPGTYDSMNILEHTVRAHEDFMLEAYPNSFVHITFKDVSRGTAGLYWGGGRMTLNAGGEDNTGLIGHEVGHLYWVSGYEWISEGGAEVLRAVAEGVPLNPKSVELHLCQAAENLAEIDRIEREQFGSTGYETGSCPYVMGLGFFSDLYTNLGDLTFREGFQRMYEIDRRLGEDRECEREERGWCFVWKAFVKDAASPEAAAIAGPIINRWYFGSPKDSQ